MADDYAVMIDTSAVPYRFDIELGGDLFTFEVHYNTIGDYFTVHLERDGAVLVYGKKLTYGEPLFGSLSDSRLPSVELVPRDVAGLETRVSMANLGVTVFLFIGEAVA